MSLINIELIIKLKYIFLFHSIFPLYSLIYFIFLLLFEFQTKLMVHINFSQQIPILIIIIILKAIVTKLPTFHVFLKEK